MRKSPVLRGTRAALGRSSGRARGFCCRRPRGGGLLGHTTDGLALLANYVEELAGGRMEREGRPTVLAETPATATWDARRLPGVWTTHLAVRDAELRARACGIGAVAIQRSHHIACLAAFLEAPARRNVLVLIFSSDPAGAHVAPYGGLTPVLTPNPIAASIPATPDPILIDVSTSITTVALCARMLAAGASLPGPWLLDRDGSPTDDPKAVTAGGALLPIGGLDHGHKGYGLSLIVEALTQGLGGYGRADEPRGWGASVFVLGCFPSCSAARRLSSDRQIGSLSFAAPPGPSRVGPAFAFPERRVSPTKNMRSPRERRCLRAPASCCANAAGGSASSRRRRCNDPPQRCAELARAAAITRAWVARSRRRRVRRDDGRASTGVCSNEGSSRPGGSRLGKRRDGRGASAACGPRSRATADRLLRPARRRNLADVGSGIGLRNRSGTKMYNTAIFVNLLTEQSQY